AAGLLVARADHLELRLLERIEQPVNLRAGQAEHGVDAVRDQTADDGFAAGSCSHCVIQSLISRFIWADSFGPPHSVSSMTPFRNTPILSASISTTSPGLS